MWRNISKRNNYCALKLGMMKLYDRTEWGYLEAITIRHFNLKPQIPPELLQTRLVWTDYCGEVIHECADKIGIF
jgi:hypothetical protein